MELIEPLSYFYLFSVQWQALQTVARISYGLTSFRCCYRNRYAKHRGTSPRTLQTKTTTPATLRWRYLYSRTQKRNRRFSRTPQRTKRRHTVYEFTKEIEENGRILFLHCLVSRDNNELRTTIYRKPTHTDRLLDQSFYNPTSHKSTTIRTLTRRAQLVYDSPDSLTDEIKYLDNVFNNNNYNRDLIRHNTYRNSEPNATNTYATTAKLSHES